MELANNNFTLIKHESTYETAFVNRILSAGSHYWEVKIDKIVDSEDVFIGVALQDKSVKNSPRDDSKMWCYLCTK